MSVETLEQAPAPVEAYAFTMNDRCDADKGDKGYSGVEVAEQAYHRWTKIVDGKKKEVFLCNHHNTKHGMALFTGGWHVEHHPLHDKLDQPMDINHIGDE